MSNFLYTIVIIVLGSYGTYILFSEFVEMEFGFSIRRILLVLRRRWYAVFALAVSLALFFHHLIDGLNS